MNKSLLTLGLALAAGSASALDTTNTAWACNSLANQNSTVGIQWCRTPVISTTTTTLGRLNVNANKQISMIFALSGTTAVAAAITPTVSYYLGNTVMATQTVSVSTAGNVVFPGIAGNPYFTAIGISSTQPTSISNSVLMVGVIENTK